MRFQLNEGAFIVGTHQPAVAHDVSREDGADPPFGTALLQTLTPLQLPPAASCYTITPCGKKRAITDAQQVIEGETGE